MGLRSISRLIGIAGIAVAVLFNSGAAFAQSKDEPPSGAGLAAALPETVRVPNFWDPQSRMERPDPQEVGAIRFLTVDNFPPFSFRDRRGMLIGFNVDLAVEICRILKVECAIQFRPFNTLEPALRQGAGDAVIAGLGSRIPEPKKSRDKTPDKTKEPGKANEKEASGGTSDPSASTAADASASGSAEGQPIEGGAPVDANAQDTQAPGNAGAAPAARVPAIQPAAPKELLYTQPYFKLPARFVTQKDKALDPNNAEGTFVGVACGSAHKAFMEVFFPGLIPICYPDLVTGLKELQAGRIDAVFGDALGLAFWLHGPESKKCCVFASGPFLSDEYFGDGLTIAVRPDARLTKDALDYAMREAHRSGKYRELYLRYFPIGLF